MDQVKQVTQVDVPQTHSTPQRVQPKVNEPITRMNRHNTPIIKKEKRTKQHQLFAENARNLVHRR
ncbi:hypothetical protein HMPREF0348_2136 [Enterococcus faecalis TX0104]|nr:hypothetical protein HMPREF0348_2136 [Enterococcus faecalis TX0104]